MGKKLISFVLLLTLVFMVVPPTALTVSATQPSYVTTCSRLFKTDSKTQQITLATGIKVKGTTKLTRTHMAAILTKVMNAQTKATKYNALNVTKTNKDVMTKAIAMGIFSSTSKFSATKKTTRQEAFLKLGELFRVDSGDFSKYEKFTDAKKVDEKAQGIFAYLAENKLIDTSKKKFNPSSDITVNEFMKIVNHLAGTIINKKGTYTKVGSGNVTVNVKDVVLSSVKIKKNLNIADGLGSGDISIKNTTVMNNVVVRGGGKNSVKVTGKSLINDLYVNSLNSDVRIFADKDQIKNIIIDSGKKDIIIDAKVNDLVINTKTSVSILKEVANALGTVEDMVLSVDKNAKIETLDLSENAAGSVINVSGKIDTINTAAKDTKIKANESSSITNIKVEKTAGQTKIDVFEGANIKNVILEAPKSEISGNAAISNISVKANDTKVSVPNAQITVDKNVTGTTVGEKVVDGGTSGTINEKFEVVDKDDEKEDDKDPVVPPVIPPVFPDGGGTGGGGSSDNKVTGITLTKTGVSLIKGEKITLSPVVTPSNALNKSVTWISSNKDIAIVDENGEVTAISAGEAIITAKTIDGGKTATCHVVVDMQSIKFVTSQEELLNALYDEKVDTVIIKNNITIADDKTKTEANTKEVIITNNKRLYIGDKNEDLDTGISLTISSGVTLYNNRYIAGKVKTSQGGKVVNDISAELKQPVTSWAEFYEAINSKYVGTIHVIKSIALQSNVKMPDNKILNVADGATLTVNSNVKLLLSPFANVDGKLINNGEISYANFELYGPIEPIPPAPMPIPLHEIGLTVSVDNYSDLISELNNNYTGTIKVKKDISLTSDFHIPFEKKVVMVNGATLKVPHQQNFGPFSFINDGFIGGNIENHTHDQNNNNNCKHIAYVSTFNELKNCENIKNLQEIYITDDIIWDTNVDLASIPMKYLARGVHVNVLSGVNFVQDGWNYGGKVFVDGKEHFPYTGKSVATFEQLKTALAEGIKEIYIYDDIIIDENIKAENGIIHIDELSTLTIKEGVTAEIGGLIRGNIKNVKGLKSENVTLTVSTWEELNLALKHGVKHCHIIKDITLNDNITIPKEKGISVSSNASLIIPADKTLTIESGGKLSGNVMNIGKIINNNEDNLEQCFSIVETYAQLQSVLKDNAQMWRVYVSGNITLPNNFTIPENFEISTTNNGRITIDSGVKVINNGYFRGNIINKGVVESNTLGVNFINFVKTSDEIKNAFSGTINFTNINGEIAPISHIVVAVGDVTLTQDIEIKPYNALHTYYNSSLKVAKNVTITNNGMLEGNIFNGGHIDNNGRLGLKTEIRVSTFEELKFILSGTVKFANEVEPSEKQPILIFINGDIEIKEDITLPKGFEVNTLGEMGKIIVPKGITVTNYGLFLGEIINMGTVIDNSDAQYVPASHYLTLISSMEELNAALIGTYICNRTEQQVPSWWIVFIADITLKNDIILPEYVMFASEHFTLTVPNGITVTNYGQIECNIINNGTVINNSDAQSHYSTRVRSMEELNAALSGTYICNTEQQVPSWGIGFIADITLKNDITIPKYVIFASEYFALTVPNGITLTNYGQIECNIINNGIVDSSSEGSRILHYVDSFEKLENAVNGNYLSHKNGREIALFVSIQMTKDLIIPEGVDLIMNFDTEKITIPSGITLTAFEGQINKEAILIVEDGGKFTELPRP